MQGYIYVLSNEAMPGLLKIGRTTTSPNQRMSELYTTGVPAKFDLRYWVEVPDNVRAESRVHRALNNVKYNKEFFKCDLGHAVSVIRGLNLNVTKEYLDSKDQLTVEKSHKTYMAQQEEKKEQLARQRAEDSRRNKILQVHKAKYDQVVSYVGWPVGLICGGYTAASVSKYSMSFGDLVLGIIVGTIVGLTLGIGAAKLLVGEESEELYKQPLPDPTSKQDIKTNNSTQPSAQDAHRENLVNSPSAPPTESNSIPAPDGYMSITDFSQIKGIPEAKLIEMIRDGFYSGRKIESQWFIAENETVNSSQDSSSSNMPEPKGYEFKWWHIFVVIVILKFFTLLSRGP